MRSPPQDEISHAVNAVSPQEDNLVDRLQVEVWQHMQLSSTNRTRAFPINWFILKNTQSSFEIQRRVKSLSMQLSGFEDPKEIPWWFSDRITPVPIPNTAEKTVHGNNTRTVRSRKDSSLPRVNIQKSATDSLQRRFLFGPFSLILFRNFLPQL